MAVRVSQLIRAGCSATVTYSAAPAKMPANSVARNSRTRSVIIHSQVDVRVNTRKGAARCSHRSGMRRQVTACLLQHDPRVPATPRQERLGVPHLNDIAQGG